MENYVDADRARNEARTIDVGTNKVHIRKSGQYGFWAITFDRGRPPDHMMGLYTSPTDAERAVALYLKSKNKLPTE